MEGEKSDHYYDSVMLPTVKNRRKIESETGTLGCFSKCSFCT